MVPDESELPRRLHCQYGGGEEVGSTVLGACPPALGGNMVAGSDLAVVGRTDPGRQGGRSIEAEGHCVGELVEWSVGMRADLRRISFQFSE